MFLCVGLGMIAFPQLSHGRETVGAGASHRHSVNGIGSGCFEAVLRTELAGFFVCRAYRSCVSAATPLSPSRFPARCGLDLGTLAYPERDPCPRYVSKCYIGERGFRRRSSLLPAAYTFLGGSVDRDRTP